jgi:uncharacterized repeat protein (TIGR03803 family)
MRKTKAQVYFTGRKPMGYGIRIVFYGLAAAAVLACAGAACPGYAQVTQTVLWSFLGGGDGFSPYTGLITDERGALYGTTGFGGGFPAGCGPSGGCGTVFKLTPVLAGQTPWTKTVLASFSGGSDGDTPLGGLFARNESPSKKKSLYGTTSGLGGFLGGGNTNGTIFKLTDGTLTTLWNFTGGSDGAFPQAALIADGETGILYGTAGFGGALGNGTVFKIDATDRTLTTIWSFSGGSDGGNPAAPLIADESGALYGTTSGGGTAGNGVVFRLTPPAHGRTAWTLTTLWSFSGGSDGNVPSAGLIADDSGALYGTTSGFASGNGTVFKLTPPAAGQTAWTLTTLYTFSGGSDGSFPLGGLIADETGALYGTTESGGKIEQECFFGGAGVVFKLTPPAAGQTAWTETVLWTFSGDSDGCAPLSELITDERGALYGTTQFGGAINAPTCIGGGHGCGVVFRLTGTGFVPKDEE